MAGTSKQDVADAVALRCCRCVAVVADVGPFHLDTPNKWHLKDALQRMESFHILFVLDWGEDRIFSRGEAMRSCLSTIWAPSGRGGILY